MDSHRRPPALSALRSLAAVLGLVVAVPRADAQQHAPAAGDSTVQNAAAQAAPGLVDGGRPADSNPMRRTPDSAAAQLVQAVVNAIADNYVDSISRAELYQAAARAVVKHLNDAYSDLFIGKDYDQFADGWEFGGVGLSYDMTGGVATVTRAVPGAPAGTAGIRPGDRIVEVDGRPTQGWTAMDLAKASRGPVGTQVTLTVHRAGTPAPMKFTLVRAQIHTAAVRPGILLPDSIGYVAIEAVTPTSAEELEQEVSALKAKGMRALILDQRENGGGDVGQSVAIADLFLDEGRPILSARGRIWGSNAQYNDEAKQRWPDLPVVVLVGSFTASGGEGITAALQDNDRVVVLGTPTYGKGIGQSQLDVAEKAALKLTTMRWYTPTGRNVQRATRDTLWGSAAVTARESSDSALRQRPLVRTVGGRPIRGGGGVVPDVVMEPATAALSAAVNPYTLLAVLTTVAFDVKKSGAVKSEDFAVTAAMRDTVYRLLRAEGVQISRRAYAALAPSIDQQLHQVVARYVFGSSAEFRYDKQVQAAIDLLQKQRNPKDLVQSVTSEQGYVRK